MLPAPNQQQEGNSSNEKNLEGKGSGSTTAPTQPIIAGEQAKPDPQKEAGQGNKPNHVKRLSSVGLQVESVLQRKTGNLKEIYSLGRKLGQGQFGTTFLCVEKETGKEFACKSIAKRKLVSEDDVEDVRREIQIMHHLAGHPNVISIAGAYEDAVAFHPHIDEFHYAPTFTIRNTSGHHESPPADSSISLPPHSPAGIAFSNLNHGELLKRKNLIELVDESPAPITGYMRNTDGAVSGLSDSSKAPRYIDTRVDELFPVRKNSITLRMLSKKENVKENFPIEHIGGLKNPPVIMNVEAKPQQPNLCTFASRGGIDCTNKTDMTGKCSNSTFQSVTQLSQGGENLNGLPLVDMDKALKGLVSCESLTASVPLSESTDITGAISALTISGAGGQVDFLSKRQQVWEDSFRSLYYMLRKKICDLFYVCTAQFVVMFTGCNGSVRTKRSCCAYISRSTRYLRSLLKEQDVSFSMPLCKSKVEEIIAEDLVELSEIEKYNLGETRRLETLTGVDNSPESLLMFTGNKNVHGLYDFLLNYRSFLASLTGVDVPVLYSPVPFQNAALFAPEVRCKEVRRADHIASQLKGTSIDGEPYQGSSAGICYIVEIKDVYLPPWVISEVCDAMQSNGTDFEANFITESLSIGLNVGLGVAREQPDQQATAGKPLQESGDSVGIRNTTLSSQMRSAFLKGLKHGICTQCILALSNLSDTCESNFDAFLSLALQARSIWNRGWAVASTVLVHLGLAHVQENNGWNLAYSFLQTSIRGPYL
ncbi:unnamed protein product [Fraxinus pennsylvanica]|uniref:non-specific serine/threonine protein kinase n=1 Tax=Fraxinus pennsylvanica TaxID=56036 RepID=A0AAD2EA84_9LAMI|nr:unnamed protein product [Fraxinus pennsylvanica]